MRLFLKLTETLLVALLVGMVLMVFGNVVLRYVFNSGLQVSEELSRFFFIWLTFIGAIVAMHDGAHLGIDSFVSRLSRRGKSVCAALCQFMILLCCVILFYGTWAQHDINATTAAPVTGLSMIWIFGIGYVVSVCMSLMALWRLFLILSGRMTDAELVGIRESEEASPGNSLEASGKP